MNPYQDSRAGLPSGPRGGGGLPSGPRGGAGPRPPPQGAPNDRYGLPSASSRFPPQGDRNFPPRESSSPAPVPVAPPPANRYNSDRYGASGGYGASRYDNAGGAPQAASRSRVGGGGYGGFAKEDDNRANLFAGAEERSARYGNRPPGSSKFSSDDTYGSGGKSAVDSNTYGGYGEQRELTAEEQEQAEIDEIKQKIRSTKLETLESTERSINIASDMMQVARGTMFNLGAQGDRLYNAERNVDRAFTQADVAADRTKELKVASRSMFAVHVDNPFTKKKRAALREKEAMDRRQAGIAREDETRQAAAESRRIVQNAYVQSAAASNKPSSYTRNTGKSMYSFTEDGEDDASDQEIEARIEQNISSLERVVSEANQFAHEYSRTIDDQNQAIDRLAQKTDRVGDKVSYNQRRLEEFK